ncbi:hypothetical protein BC829DRAFT_260852 [Chytridium lagenaria]|nr:hypothetical protein BC829DRAFT_260852 [Chytridium lagenaria]
MSFDIFSRGQLDKDKVIVGKKEKSDSLAKESVTTDLKSSILNRVKAIDEEEAAFEAIYDDEYDDTYDSTDIKFAGTIELQMLDEVETQVSPASRVRAPIPEVRPEEEVLMQQFVSGNTKVFELASRKSPERGKLRLQTGMTDEQIEGWFKMTSRDVSAACPHVFLVLFYIINVRHAASKDACDTREGRI